jgi:hypothetical protein
MPRPFSANNTWTTAWTTTGTTAGGITVTTAWRTAWAVAFAILLFVAPNAPLSAQAADPADVGSIDDIVTAVYDVISGDAGEARDWDRWHSLFTQGAILSSVGQRQDGSVGRNVMTPQTWIDAAGEMVVRDGFVEAEIGRTTEQFGLIAHVFSTYVSFRSRADTVPFQRGINSFQLMNDGDRWWVVSVFFQGESEAFPIPEQYVGDIGGMQ